MIESFSERFKGTEEEYNKIEYTILEKYFHFTKKRNWNKYKCWGKAYNHHDQTIELNWHIVEMEKATQ